MSRIRAAAVGAAAAAILVVSGCGDDSSEQLSHAEMIKQGDEICRRVGAETSKALGEKGKELEGASGTEQLVNEVSAGVKRMAEEIDGLEPPEADSQQVDEIVAEFENAAEKAEAEPEQAAKENVFKDAADKARAYGFQYCSQI